MVINKKRLTFIFSIFLLFSCSKSSDISQTDLFPENGVLPSSINHNGSSRNYALYIPPGYNGKDALPVVFNFHGSNDNALDHLFNTSDMRSVASFEQNPFFLVYPEAGICDGKTTWNSSAQGGVNCLDDLDFIETLIDSLSLNFKIDESKIYACGYSEGGAMALSLGVSKSNRFAAVGSVSGTMLNFNTPLNPMPTIIVHGTDDGVFPYLGDTVNNSIQLQLDFWVHFNNTETVPLLSSETNNFNGITTEHYRYIQGDNNVAVEHYKIIGGIHSWRLDQAIFPAGSSADDDTGLLLWKFFENYSK
jgi:polyhydroxybutyrate depolymerase